MTEPVGDAPRTAPCDPESVWRESGELLLRSVPIFEGANPRAVALVAVMLLGRVAHKAVPPDHQDAFLAELPDRVREAMGHSAESDLAQLSILKAGTA